MAQKIQQQNTRTLKEYMASIGSRYRNLDNDMVLEMAINYVGLDVLRKGLGEEKFKSLRQELDGGLGGLDLMYMARNNTLGSIGFLGGFLDVPEKEISNMTNEMKVAFAEDGMGIFSGSIGVKESSHLASLLRRKPEVKAINEYERMVREAIPGVSESDLIQTVVTLAGLDKVRKEIGEEWYGRLFSENLDPKNFNS